MSKLDNGVIAGYLAVRELGVKSRGMEEVIAIVETNNCFADGIQVVTGCTFGNNALIFKNVGKTAVTVAKQDGTAIRIALDYIRVSNLLHLRKEGTGAKSRDKE